MIFVHFLVPPDVVIFLTNKVKLTLRHRDNFAGYFADITIEDFYKLLCALNRAGYRTDVNPSEEFYTLNARHINHKAAV